MARKKASKDRNVDNNDNEDETEEPSSNKRKTRSSPGRSASRKAMAKLKEESTEEEEEQDDDDSGKDDESKEQDTSAKDDEDEDDDENNYEEDEKDEEDEKPKKKQKTGKDKPFNCPHCPKGFTSKGGLDYHLANYVCRLDQCTDPEIIAKATRKKRPRGKSKQSSTDTKKTYKKFRGKLEDRVCQHCKRVFTSTLGLQYHESRKVCQQKVKPEVEKVILHTLQPGERFMTTFGPVQVVSDDRGESTAPVPKLSPAQMRSVTATRSRVAKQRKKAYVSKFSRLRARRYRINELLAGGKSINKASVFFAYHGGNPTELNQNIKLAPLPPKVADPSTPPESMPDRIVECVWLQPDGSAPENPTSAQRLFLQRRLLTERYVDRSEIFACEDCGYKFTSYPGYKYHTEHRVCKTKSEKRTDARKERQELVEQGAARLREKKESPQEYLLAEGVQSGTASEKAKIKKKKRKKTKELGMYPEVLISLGYKVVNQEMEITEDMLFQSTEPFLIPKTEPTPKPTLSLITTAPDTIMEDLKEKLLARQRVSDDQKYGSMYKEVYKALGYAKPRKRKGIGSATRRKRAKVVKPPPPIVDISALADEVDSGRYPSKKRYKGDDHTDECVICKEGGTLLCCDFCRNAVHMHCMADKFTIKAPEPDEDFMCHKCIQVIITRRKRAEGRRLKKQEKDEQDRITTQNENPDIKAGREYEQLASKGQEYSELIELLQDARQRLRQSLATSKMNDIRRKLIQFE